MTHQTYKRWLISWWIAAACLLAFGFYTNAPAQQPNGVINSPIYATGYIAQVGGTNVTTKIAAQPNHPTNLNIYTTSAVTGTWSIQLPNPAFEGQILSFNCGASATTISISTSDGSSIDSGAATSCSALTGFSFQFDARDNIWRILGTGNTSISTAITINNNTQLTALSSSITGPVIRLGYAAAGDAPPVVYTRSNSACSLNAGAGDGGSQVPTSDGKCWLAKYADTIDIRGFCSATQRATDISTCAQNAINAAQAFSGVSYGGATVYFPASASPYKLTGTLSVTGSFVNLKGDGPQGSFINCQNGASDCISIGSAASASRRQSVKGLGIIGTSKTGGAGIHFVNTYDATAEDLALDNMWRGIDVDYSTNSTSLRHITINLLASSTDKGIYFHAAGDGSNRSDALRLDNVVVSGQWGASTLLELDGFANTITGSGIRLLHAAYGIRIRNTSASASYIPQFGNLDDVEAEGFTTRALSMESGYDFRFSNSDFNNLTGSHGTTDDYAVACTYDSTALARALQISNSRIGLSQKSGVYSDCLNTALSNIVFASTSFAGVGSYPVIQFGSHASRATLGNITCEEYGGSGRASNCIATDALTTSVSVNGAIDGNGINSTVFSDGAGFGKTILSRLPALGIGKYNPVTDGEGAGIRVDQDATTGFKCINNNATASAQCRYVLATGTGNSFANIGLVDNSGSPYLTENYGSAVKARKTSLPIQSTAYAFSSPTAGSTVTIGDQQDNLILNPAGTLSTLTVVLPSCSAMYDGKVSRISTTQAITTLTVNATAGTINGAPLTLGVSGFMSFLCRGGTTTWFRNG